MKASNRHLSEGGFSLLEMLVALAIFLIITGVAFSLLGLSQKRYQTESQVLSGFQEARLALDQIVRDVNDAGYPPANQFQFGPQTPPVTMYAASGFAWPNYSSSCFVGACATPSRTDLIVETQLPQQCPSGSSFGVSWIRYQLVGTTLLRGVTCKTTGDPATDSTANGAMVPYVQNVVNMTTAPNAPVPVFTYTCGSASTAQPCANGNYLPSAISAVDITLVVQASVADAQTGLPRLVELNGRGRILNTNQ